ncbi:cytochrome P450 [Streptomyces collinus]|uniref:cytochrome P450 n=1 Tax=Streptomyces collinus TaxID=42684 RepID=UPI00367F9FC5
MRAAIVQEVIRYVSVLPGVTRVATADVVVGGQSVAAGDVVVVSLPAASWDPDEFTNPHLLSSSRPINHHPGFGHGIARCLERLLAQELFATILH